VTLDSFSSARKIVPRIIGGIEVFDSADWTAYT
jgi:hypothetical protein